MATAEKVYQKTSLYVLISSGEGQLLVSLKKLLLQRPLTQVYVVNESFFNWLEFQKNPLWKKEIDRIFWLKSSFDTNQSYLENQIFSFLSQFQDKLSVIGLNYSPPPVDWQHREVGRQWLSLVRASQNFYSRLSLNFPQAQVLIGQDVLLEEKISLLPFCALWSFWQQSTWKVWSSGQYYWQTWEDFWLAIEPKILNPLSKMRYLIVGKKVTAEKWLEKQAQLIGSFEEREVLLAPLEARVKNDLIGTACLENVWAGQLVKIKSDNSKENNQALSDKWLLMYQVACDQGKPFCLTENSSDQVSQKPKHLTSASLFHQADQTIDQTNILFQNISQTTTPQLFNLSSSLKNPSFSSTVQDPKSPQKTEIDPSETPKPTKKTTIIVRGEKNTTDLSSSSLKTRSRLLPAKQNPQNSSPTKKTQPETSLSLENSSFVSSSIKESSKPAIPPSSVVKSNSSFTPPSKFSAPRKRFRQIGFSLIALFLVLVFIFFSVWRFSLKNYLSSLASLSDNCLFNTKNCQWETEWQNWQQAKSAFDWQKTLYSFVLSPTVQNDFQQLNDFANQIANFQDNQQLLAAALENVFLSLTGRQSVDLTQAKAWEQLLSIRAQEQDLLAVLLATSTKLSAQNHLSTDWLDQLSNRLKTLQSDSNLLSQREKWWQEILKTSRFEPQAYALVVFNPLFARPTGGLIEAVTILEVNHGRLESITTYSAEEINSQLSARFLPSNSSFAGQLMGENKVNFWSLSQETDFSQLAEKTASYLNEALNIKIAGVFGLNANLWIDQNNPDFWSTSRLDFSDQNRAAYWKTLIDDQLVKLISTDGEDILLTTQNLTDAFSSRRLFAWLADESLQAQTQQLNRTGTLVTPSCQQLFNTSSCVNDNLIFTETLLGKKDSSQSPFSQPENALNYNLETQINLTPDKIEHTLNLTARSEASNKSQYYWQFFFPRDVQITQVLLNGVQTDLNAENGLLVDFTDRQQQSLVVQYSLSSAFNENGWTYTYYQRYPTTVNSWQNAITVYNHTTLPYQVVSPNADYQDQALKFVWYEPTDLFISIGF